MDTIISVVLGDIASWVQGKRGKALGKVTRFVISIGSCVTVGLVASFVENMDTGGLTVDQALSNIGTAFLMSQTFYKAYFRKPKVNAEAS